MLDARHTQKIRCLKLIARGLPLGDIIGAFWGASKLSHGGVTLTYPTPLHTPLVFLAPPSAPAVYLQSLDDRVRAKRFAFYERAKQAYCIVATGERRFYGCFVFKKGVIPAD